MHAQTTLDVQQKDGTLTEDSSLFFLFLRALESPRRYLRSNAAPQEAEA
jgi:hypothetical protein